MWSFTSVILLGRVHKLKRKRRRSNRSCQRGKRLVFSRTVSMCRFVRSRRVRWARMKCRLSTRQKVMVRRGFKFRSKPKFPSPVSDKEMPEFSQSKSAWSKFSKAYVDLLCSGVLVGGTLNQYKKHPPRRKYAKRGEGNSNTLGEQTRDLIAALKQCLNNEPSLEHLWSALRPDGAS